MITKYNIIFVFFISLLFVSKDCREKYYFDYLIEYKSVFKTKKGYYINSFFINSKDDDYSMKLVESESQFKGIINDNQSESIHYFDVKNLPNSIFIKYINSEFREVNEYKNPYLLESYIEKKEDSTSMLTILAFKNKNKRKFSRKIVINYDNSDLNFPKSIINFFSHGTLIDREIKFPKGIPTKINVLHENLNEVEYTLFKKEKINTTLSSKI